MDSKMDQIDSAFGENVTNQRIFEILEKNKFKFEKFGERDGLWDRWSKTGKTFYIVLTFITCFVLLLFIPLFIFFYKKNDKVFNNKKI